MALQKILAKRKCVVPYKNLSIALKKMIGHMQKLKENFKYSVVVLAITSLKSFIINH